MGLVDYFKSAFLGRWNLLALFGATGFSVLSGYPEVFLPLVAAGEILYVGMLGSNPRFQSAVDAQSAAASRGDGQQASNQALQQILSALPRSLLVRYERLRSRCLELRKIAGDLKRSRGDGPQLSLDNFQMEGLDKLLWIFVRLLFTHHALEQFLQRADSSQMEEEVQQLETRLKGLSGQPDSPHVQKMRHTLEDHLETSKSRLENYKKAAGNQELVALELDRLENKISTLAEMAVNRQEPDFIAGQVDQVAGSMLEMEKTMTELEFATGLPALESEAPAILQQRESRSIKATR